MRHRWLSLLVLSAAATWLAACASEPSRGRGHGGHFEGRRGGGEGGGRERTGRGVNLFISPAGEPFRSAPGDPYPVSLWFDTADADHDGKLTRAEFREDAERFFRQIDSNHDGVIDGAELSVYEHAIAPEILAQSGGEGPGEGARQQQWSGGHGGGGGGGRGGGGRMGRRGGRGSDSGEGSGSGGQARTGRSPRGAIPYSLVPETEPVSAADTDFNGKITLAEFKAAADRHFAELDAAGVGFLTLTGLPKTPIQSFRARSAFRSSED